MSTLFITVSFPQKWRSLLTKCESLDEIFAWSQFIKRVNVYIVFRLVSALHTNKRNLIPGIRWNVIEVHFYCWHKRSDIYWKTVNFYWEHKGYSYIKVILILWIKCGKRSYLLHTTVFIFSPRREKMYFCIFALHTHFHMITSCISILSTIRCVTDLRLQDRGVCVFLYHDMLFCLLNFKREKKDWWWNSYNRN